MKNLYNKHVFWTPKNEAMLGFFQQKLSVIYILFTSGYILNWVFINIKWLWKIKMILVAVGLSY